MTYCPELNPLRVQGWLKLDCVTEQVPGKLKNQVLTRAARTEVAQDKSDAVPMVCIHGLRLEKFLDVGADLDIDRAGRRAGNFVT